MMCFSVRQFLLGAWVAVLLGLTVPLVEAASFFKKPLAIMNDGGGVLDASKATTAQTTTTTTTSSRKPTLHANNNNNNNDNNNQHAGVAKEAHILSAAVAVGSITAGVGFLYGQLLDATVTALYQTVPALLQDRAGIPIHPMVFIPCMLTLGGFLIGLITTQLPVLFTVADFVSALSSAPTTALPSSRGSLLPVLVLSLLTSAFGFSVGPEAPMVCAGALIGSSLGRRWFAASEDATTATATLAYAGAAGALTAFMGIPIAGSIFALEMTRSSAGMASSSTATSTSTTTTSDALLSPVIAASVAGIVLLRALLVPQARVGGHFDYGSVHHLSGSSMIAAALGSGVGGAILGTIFHRSIAVLKRIFWTMPAEQSTTTTTTTTQHNKAVREITVKTLIGLVVGLLSVFYPVTMFWGEGSLQCMVDGQTTPLASTKHGFSSILASAAQVNPNVPFATAWDALQVGVVKLLAIVLACAGKFPGGIIFPLFFAAPPFAHAVALAFSSSSSSVVPVLVMCLMASTQASVTRTPLATALILSLSASSNTQLSVMLPPCLVSAYVGLWTSQLLSQQSYFKYSS